MKLLGISVIALLAISCSPTKMLQNRLNNYELPIGYIHDTKQINCYKFDSLIVHLNNNPLDSMVTVSLKHRHVQYWVFYVSKDIKWNIQLGEEALEKWYNDFFLESFQEESKRTGCYAVSNRVASDSIYTLDITMDTCQTNADYHFQMWDAFGLLKMTGTCYPSETNMHVLTKLTRGGKLITEKIYSIKRRQTYLPLSGNDGNKLLDFLMSNMVESLSLSTKECVEKIINDLNLSITVNHFNR